MTDSQVTARFRAKLQFIRDLDSEVDSFLLCGGMIEMDARNSLSGYYENIVYMLDDKAYVIGGAGFASACLKRVQKLVKDFIY